MQNELVKNDVVKKDVVKNLSRIILFGACALLTVWPGLPQTLVAQDNFSPAPLAGARRITLRQAVALALENNRDVLLAEVAVARAEAEHREAESVFKPQVLVGTGLAATRGFPLSIEGSAPSIFHIAATQALFNPNLKNVARQAGQMREATQRSLEAKRDEIIAQTVLTYLDLDRSRRSLEYARSQRQNLLAAERIVNERVQAGLETPLERTRARLQTARSRRRSVALENQVAMLEFTLRDLIGVPQSEAILTETAQVPGAGLGANRMDATVEEATADETIERAVRNNEGIKSLEAQVRAREFQVQSEQGTRWPRVNLVGQYGLFSDINNFSDFFRKFARHNATFGISVVMPVYDRARFSARLSKAEAELAAARYRLSSARAGIDRQVRELMGETEQQAAAQEVAQLELELARSSLDATLAQYEEGRINRLALEQARFAENESWLNFLEVGYQTERARLELLRITGEIRAVFQ